MHHPNGSHKPDVVDAIKELLRVVDAVVIVVVVVVVVVVDVVVLTALIVNFQRVVSVIGSERGRQ